MKFIFGVLIRCFTIIKSLVFSCLGNSFILSNYTGFKYFFYAKIDINFNEVAKYW